MGDKILPHKQSTSFQLGTKVIFKPLVLPTIFHQYPSKGFKVLAIFSGEEEYISVEQHIMEFEYFLDIVQIIYEDAALRMFCHSLKHGTHQWFQCLEASSISSWQGFQDIFLRYWGERKSYEKYLLELYSIQT